MSTLIKVKPTDVKKWHGKYNKESFSQPLVLESLYDDATGKYATGLSEEEKEKLSAATGFDLSDDYNPDEGHPFWGSKTAQVKLPYRTTIFDTNKSLDIIKIGILKASKFVANSQAGLEEGLYPDATFVIFDEAEEVKIKATKIQQKRKANEIVLKMNTDDKANIIQIISGKSMRGQSQSYLDVEMDEILDTKIEEFTILISRTKQSIYDRALVLEAIHKNILQKEGNAVLYMGDRIGFNTDEAVKHLSNPENQAIKALILEKL